MNHYLRLGLMASNRPARKKFVVRPRPLGLPQGLSYDNVEEQAAALEGALTEGQAAGPLANDAGIAALTIECGGVLHTPDRDFARFPGLRWVNLLEPQRGRGR